MEKLASEKRQYVTASSVRTGKGYGLAVELPDGRTLLYSDISRKGELVEEISDKINRGNVSEIHVDDVIEDILG